MHNSKFSTSLRLPKGDKSYWLCQLQEFSNHFASMQVSTIHFGKQDIRGVPSISFVDHNGCISFQEHFRSSEILLAFVQGYNMAEDKACALNQYKKRIFRVA